MKKLISLAAASAALLFVSVCVGLMTAPTSQAQAGQTGKDVRVVNTSSEAVPVDVQSLPSVQISGTANVNVNSLPAVQVGNGAGNPVPVSVTNLPPAQAIEDPVNVQNSFLMFDNQSLKSKVSYVVPVGKVFHLEQVTFLLNDASGTYGRQSRVRLAIPAVGGQTFFYLSVDEREVSDNGIMAEIGTKSLNLRFGPGTEISFEVLRPFAGTELFASWTFSGVLSDVP